MVESSISHQTIKASDLKDAVFLKCTKEDSSKVSQMVIAEFSTVQMKVVVSSVTSRKKSHVVNIRDLLLEEPVLNLELRKEPTWPSHVKSTHIKPVWLRQQMIPLVTPQSSEEETITKPMIDMLNLKSHPHIDGMLPSTDNNHMGMKFKKIDNIKTLQKIEEI